MYDINSRKKKGQIPDTKIESSNYQCKTFLSAQFDPKSERNKILTLHSEPDWCITLWRWDEVKVILKIDLGITGDNLLYHSSTF